MKLVIDANVLFSSLIKESKTTELIINPFLSIYAPEFLLEEFYKHKSEILEKTKRSELEFEEIFNLIRQIINIIPDEEFMYYLNEADKISPDPNDSIYFALALKMNISIQFGVMIKS